MSSRAQGGSPERPGALPAGTRLGPYEVISLLGAGGMGEVYRARDTRLGREVALKVLHEGVLGDEDRLRRFEQEARAVASLNHPNILTVHDVGTQDGTPYVVAELLEGQSLREVVLQRSPTLRQVLGWALQTAQGLAAAHRKGVVHRDLKPENLFLTTDGRIKILDFGLAKQVDATSSGTRDDTATANVTKPGLVMGTVAYMSPEQVQAWPVDARSDIFSFGVVLYELLSGKHPFQRGTVAATLAAILQETPVPLSRADPSIPRAVDGIVSRCLEKRREERFQGAHDLGLALETVLAAPAGSAALDEVEERSPYPGLSSFTEKDASVFFGREAEVKALWERIRSRHLLAVIGPSGAGKTSFVRAGVVAGRPEGWTAIVCTPGRAPLRGLGRALGPELAGDPEALRKFADFEEQETAFELLARWRRVHGDALVVVDQFEELFTLSAPETQARFASLLGRLAGDADVHVVISLRDDFLIRCCEQAPLAPVLTQLTALLSLDRDALRRALVEPAKKRGYRFEDDALASEMVEAVEGARAALPLLAFAVSRLWEKRDRERKLLTRQAYEEIGGVAGALAQHAEATMERIGTERQSLVRELFRNLVTGQGTRAVIDREELLSAFPDRAAAEQVLGQLVDARLLTSYEVESDPGEPPRNRIEVVHESLLKAWPRLVRWQTQDEEGALLRDQLKQAAHLWDEKGRTGDLLWTGTAYQEFELWRGRYPGALTSLEDQFAKGMADKARRKKRIARAVTAAVVIALAGIAIVIGFSRQQALAAARRAEAAKLLAIGQERLAADPTEALAYTTASLETADSREARLFALKALWEAPPALELALGKWVIFPDFSPDGRQLATAGGGVPEAHLFREDGGPPRVVRGTGMMYWVAGHLVLDQDLRALLYSLPDLRLERTLEFGGLSFLGEDDGRLSVITEITGKDGRLEAFALRSWTPGEAALVELGRVPPGPGTWGPGGTSWLYAKGAALLARPLPISPHNAGVVLGEHPPEITQIPYMPASGRKGQRVTINRDGEMRLWTFAPGQAERFEDIPTPQGADVPNGRLGRLSTSVPNDTNALPLKTVFISDTWMYQRGEQSIRMWPRGSWSAARPLVLRRDLSWNETGLALHPSGDWMVAPTKLSTSLTFWPLRQARPLVVDGFRNRPAAKLMVFSPDGRWLATSWPDAPVRLWPLVPGSTTARKIEIPGLRGELTALAFDPNGRFLFCVGNTLWIAPLDGRAPVKLEGFARVPVINAAAVSPSGRYVAAGYYNGENVDRTLRVWDLEKGTTWAYDLPQPPPRRGKSASTPAGKNVRNDGIVTLVFPDELTLYTGDYGGIRRWDLATGKHELVIGAEETLVDAIIRPKQGLALTCENADVPPRGCAAGKIHDLVGHTSRKLTASEIGEFGSHMRGLRAVDLATTGQILAAGGPDGIIRIRRLSGGEPHLLVGHKGGAFPAISPDLKWIASTGQDNTLRLWPMPDLDKPPLHTLPHAELVAKLKSLTNLRAVRDVKAAGGWRIETGPFPGWKTLPTWQP